MCFENEILHDLKSKKSNVAGQEDLEIEPELEEVEEQVIVSTK